MAAFRSASVKKVRCRSAARTQRWAIWTLTSTLGLSVGVRDARGNHHRAIVAGEVGVGAVDLRFVAVRRRDAALQIVRDPDRRTALKVVQHADVRADPRRQILAPRGLGVDQAARAEHADEELDRRSPRRSCGSTRCGRLPEKSTNSFSPARCTWRIDGFSARAHRRYRSQNWL